MSGTAVLERVVDGRVVAASVELDELSTDALAAGLGDAVVAEVLRAKDCDDPVPTAVWWLVVDALRRSLGLSGSGVQRDRSIAMAAVAIERATWQLTEQLPLLLTSGGPAEDRAVYGDSVRALRRAQVLVARLLLSTAPTSPTLLQVRLDRLSRALLAGLSPG